MKAISLADYKPVEISIETVKLLWENHKEVHQQYQENQQSLEDLLIKAQKLMQELNESGHLLLESKTEGMYVLDQNHHFENIFEATLNDLKNTTITATSNVEEVVKAWEGCIDLYLLPDYLINFSQFANPILAMNNRKKAREFGAILSKLQPFLDLKNLYNELEQIQDKINKYEELKRKSFTGAQKPFKTAFQNVMDKAEKIVREHKHNTPFHFRLNILFQQKKKYLNELSNDVEIELFKNDWLDLLREARLNVDKAPQDVKDFYNQFVTIANLHNANIRRVSSPTYLKERLKTLEGTEQKSSFEGGENVQRRDDTLTVGTAQRDLGVFLYFARYASDYTLRCFAIAVAVIAIGLVIAACCTVSPAAIGFFAAGCVVTGKAAALSLPVPLMSFG